MDPGERQDEVPDYINELEEDVVLNIVSRLGLRDSVVARMLSPWWRGVWDSNPPSRLVFDWESMLLTENTKADWERLRNPCVEYRNRFLNAVDQFLNFYRGSNVELVSVRFCLGKEHANRINNWIDIAAKRIQAGIVKLKLHCVKLCEDRDKDDMYELHKDLFLCNDPKLKILDLTGVKVIVLASRFLLDFIPAPPSKYLSLSSLKEVTLIHCWLPDVLHLASLSLLEKLWAVHCLNVNTIGLLRHLQMTSVAYIFSRPIAINTQEVPNLLDLRRFADNEYGLSTAFSRAAEEHQSLKTMCIHSYVDWGNSIPGIEEMRAPRTVTCLVLALDRRTTFNGLKLVTLLRFFPNLKELKLRLNCSTEAGNRLTISGGYNGLKHLEEVEFSGFHDTVWEIEFVVFLLNCAGSLKKLSIFQMRSSLDYLLLRKPICWIKESGQLPWNNAQRESIRTKLLAARKDIELLVQ